MFKGLKNKIENNLNNKLEFIIEYTR